MSRLVAFDLERYLRALEPKARFPIGGSGVPRGDIVPFLPDTAERSRALWLKGTDETNRALADAVARAYAVPAEEVMTAVGASEADMIAVLGLAGPGAHVVVEKPAYHALLAPALAIGCRVTRVERRAEEGFALDVARVAAAFTPDTKLVLLANPHNPTGARLSAQALRELGDAASRVGAYVVVDEVFADATEAGDRPARLAHDHIITVNSVTKCLGFSPLRVGWLVAPRRLHEDLDRAKAVMSVQNAMLDVWTATRVLDARSKLLRATRDARREGARLVGAMAARAKIEWSRPEHGTTAVLRVDGDDIALARDLLATRGALVAPGSHIELPRWVRVGLVTPAATLEPGLAELEAALR